MEQWAKATAALEARIAVLADQVANLRAQLEEQRPEVAVQNVIRAQRIEIVDEKRELRAVLSTDESGSVLFLADEDAKIRAGLRADRAGAYLHFTDENGVPHVSIISSEVGTCLEVAGENGKSRAGFYPTKDGGIEVCLFDENDEVVFQAPR